MNVLFLTLVSIRSLDESGIYMDLMRCFEEHGHEVYIVSPIEKKYNTASYVEEKSGLHIVHCQTGNLFNVGMVEKGISQLRISKNYMDDINRFLSDIKFDLILYSTPPVTLVNVVSKVKQQTGAKTYLLLKDIFPQNAVDIGLFSTNGTKGLMLKYFKRQEKKLYQISDYIGCMSPANVEYLLRNNRYISNDIVEVCPNSIKVSEVDGGQDNSSSREKRLEILSKYNIPTNKVLFIYGGNLGKPQDIPFVIQCIRKCQSVQFAHFIVCGNGTEYGLLEKFIENEKPDNFTLIAGLPKEEYDQLASVCDVGLLFLDHRFTIPNFPSRLLSYMAYGMPVLACTDVHTDIGRLAEAGKYGYACESNDVDTFVATVKKFENAEERIRMGQNAYKYLQENYDVEQGYSIIMKHFMEK